MSTANQAGNAPAQAPQGSWIGRHKFLTFLVLFIVIAFVGGVVAGWPYLKPRFHSQYSAALDEIRQSPEAKERLGEPIQPTRFLPSGDITDNTAKLTFEVTGPKDTAAVNAFSRLIDGQWGFAVLELQFKNGQRISLAHADDTPKFDPNAKQPEVKAPDMPVDIQLPEMPPMPKK